jgi:hypothetical protein
VENGITVVQFFLHISKDEQRERFLERIDDKSKNWKFSESDLSERGILGRLSEGVRKGDQRDGHEKMPVVCHTVG